MRRLAVRVARADHLPNVDLLASGRLQIQSNKLDFTRDDVNQSWLTELTMSFPLFDEFRTGSRVARAKTGVLRVEAELDLLECNLDLEVRAAWLELRVARERLASERKAVVQARRGLEISESRYSSGLGTQLELIDSQLSLRGRPSYRRVLQDFDL